MSPAPLISVIIPTCFREVMLIDCVASLLSQTYPSFEVIVVDQAPQPALKAALQKVFAGDQRICYLHAFGAGAARARNIGVGRAAGSIVAFIDDDAVADAGWLRAIADAFANNLQPALMAGRIFPLWDGSRPAWYPREREYLLGVYDIGDDLRQLPTGDLPIGANMAGLRGVILAHGGFEETLGPNYFRRRKMVTGEETVLGQRILAAGHVAVYQPGATVRHHVSKRKQTRRFFLKRHFWEGVTVSQQMQLLGQIGQSKKPHYTHHTRQVCRELVRFLFPGYGNVYPEPHGVIRMLALARTSYSLGVMWGLRAIRADTKEEKQCASA